MDATLDIRDMLPAEGIRVRRLAYRQNTLHGVSV